MKVLLLGANGQVGQGLRRRLPARVEIIAATRDGKLVDGNDGKVADLADPERLAFLVDDIAPDIVINAAAYTAVDRAEQELDLAWRVNAEAPGVLARACAIAGIPLIHYSTDYVFDGAGSRPYREDDATAPLGVYGASKRAGEEAIAASGARHLILRTAWVYATHGHNFMRTMLRLGAERDELRVVADQVGSPTPAWLIADATAAVIGRGIVAPGTRHLTASGETTWHGFAEAIFDEAMALGLIGRRPLVTAIATTEYPTRAARPAYSVLDTTRLREEYAIELPGWRQALRRTLSGLAG